MKIVTVRRISQGFFLAFFLWFAFVSSVGAELWQLRKWPVNWFLQLDPLVAAGTMLTSHGLYWPLLWALAVVVLTILLGRFFCGWVCPFGTIHHFTGYLAHRKKPLAQKLELNKYRQWQKIKYFVLAFFAGAMIFQPLGVGLYTGLLDPIPLVTRTFNLALMPVLDKPIGVISAGQRFYVGAWLIFGIFAAAVLLNLLVPRFYCRFICPLGAMFGILDRFAIWRIGKRANKCPDCRICEKACEGGCQPAGKIRIAECVLCFNCRQDCVHDLIRYQVAKSKAGEVTGTSVSRRGFMLSIAGGVLAVPAVRLSGQLAGNWDNKVIRPPGALAEEEFLKRCIKCGQCVRVCPTNVLQLRSAAGGLEGLWTPTLNNRIGSSGCQLNCVACGSICPTGAIRPISLDEKHGTGEFADAGPIRLGTAFFDRNRCLPWAMDKPCIVCQENCPVSPKAIYTREYYNTIRGGELTISSVEGNIIETLEGGLSAGALATGDYFCAAGNKLWKISANTEKNVIIAEEENFEEPVQGSKIEIKVRLQRPYVDIEKCIGCGICEHECPVSGKKAVRVSAEGQSRDGGRGLYI